MMTLYKVAILRTAFQTKDIVVRAANARQAQQNALEQAPNEEFQATHHSEYAVESCAPVDAQDQA
jgi:hypothetical protein